MSVLVAVAMAALLGSQPAASAAQVAETRMAYQIVREDGRPPRMTEVALDAGDVGEDDPFYISFYFENDENGLGKSKGVGLQLDFGTYCRDRASWVEAVLIAPSGRSWAAHRVGVPAGPDRQQDWSSGGLKAPALIKAVEAGGRFTLALRDDEGRLWNSVAIDVPPPEERARLYASHRAAIPAEAPEAAAPAADPGMIQVIEREPVVLPSPPRRCPAA